MGSVLDSFIFEELKGELRRLQHLGEKVIMPKVVHLMQWKEDADKRLEHAHKRLGVTPPVQKMHSRQLEEMRADVANEVRVWAKTEIEKISRDVDTLKSFVRATIERMKLEEAKKTRQDDTSPQYNKASSDRCAERVEGVEQAEKPNQKEATNTPTPKGRKKKKRKPPLQPSNVAVDTEKTNGKDREDVCSTSGLECVVQDPNQEMPSNNAAMQCTSETARIPTVEFTVVKMEDRECQEVLQSPRATDDDWGLPMQQGLFEPVSRCNVAAQLDHDTYAMPLLLKSHSGSHGWRCSTDACLTHSKKNYCINGNCCQYSHLLAPDLVTATVEMIRLRPRRSFPADAVPVEESQYPTFLAERMCRLNLYQSGEAPVCFSSDQTFY